MAKDDLMWKTVRKEKDKEKVGQKEKCDGEKEGRRTKGRLRKDVWEDREITIRQA